MRRITSQNTSFGVFLAFLLIPLSGIGTDVYIPSMPAMATDLNTTPARIQLTLTLFIAGYGLGQLAVGPLLDRHGRYRPTLIALILFAVSSAIISASSSIWLICALRLLQGLMGAVVVVSKRTFFVDLFSGPALQRYLTWMTVVWSLGPICAPFIGGFVQAHLGWRANFTLLALFAILAVALEVRGGGESLKQPQPIQPRLMAQRMWQVMSHGPFARGVLCVGIAYALVLCWSMASPFIIETVYHQPPTTTGTLALLMGVAWMCGGLTARALLAQTLLRKQQGALAAMAIALALLLALPPAWRSLETLALAAFVIHMAAGLTFNINFTNVLSMFPHSAALSGGLAGGLVFILASALSSMDISLLHPRSVLGMVTAYGVLAVLLVPLMLSMRAPRVATT